MQYKKTILGILAAMVVTIGTFGIASAQTNSNGYHDNEQYHNIPQHEQQSHGTYHE